MGKKEEVLPSFQILNAEIPTLPDNQQPQLLDFRYPLIAPYVNAHIHFDTTTNELLYDVEEPLLSPEEKEMLGLIEEGIEELINLSVLNVKNSDMVIDYLEKNIKVILNELGLKINQEAFIKIMYYVYRDFVGLNEIEPLMKDYFIEDIECNGNNTPIYIVHRKYGNMKTNIIFTKEHYLESFVEKLAQKCGKYISYAKPLLDAQLPDGSRINATFSQDISARGPSFSIRKFTKEPFTPIKLMQMNTVSPELLAYLWILIEHEANIMVIGATGAGKTSFINSLAFFIPPQARIVSIEDTREINLLHENWLPSVAREGVGIGEGNEIDLFTLLKESFRQRPDYVIVGEIRGKEAYVLFQGAASGHATMSTMHAEDVQTMIRRLETAPINLSPTLVNSLDVVCTMTTTKMKNTDVRRLKEIVEIIEVGNELGSVATNIPFVWEPRTDTFYFKTESAVFEKIMRQQGLDKHTLEREFTLRSKLLMQMYRKGITKPKEVQEIINAYYKTPASILQRFNITP
ncbi:MAG: type II/IV secretion system ATPase subunit [Nanoarchaeota archaeon]|nr:type II/IV secretion system ATPase subunit [Nanoarchaeota archaeon]